ncbi:MAG TPA: hypothetical protein DIU20_14145 [Cryomorphaceae bacterium]|nr:hypothetical protein [Cryomorphaceae bacterium]
MIVAFALSGFIPATAIFIKTGFSGVSYYMAAGLAGLLISIAFLLMAQKKKHYVMLNNMYRLLIIGGILSLMLFT